jgi:catechol 2,3-dioxygenase-like lactoylglutathione lyase family enzyme
MIKVKDVLYARFRAPDLDKMETFLTDFGLTRSARTETALYMRGTDPHHHAHITELGDEPAFIGFAFEANSEDDLAAIAQAEGASDVEEIKEPGGGKRVRLTDPDGFQVEIVHGIEKPAPQPLINHYESNYGSNRQRRGVLVRLTRGPAQCKRLGHVVLNITDFKTTDAFYKSHFGMVSSDELTNDEGEVIIAFNRVDRGQEFVDHHTLLTVPAENADLGHIAFEVEDVNAVYLGHEHLVEQGYTHSWGIGRHILGSQIFDYWFDPYDFRVEHWTDGDLLNEDSPMGTMHASEALEVQWGSSAASRRT